MTPPRTSLITTLVMRRLRKGIEWEDDMAGVNRMTTPAIMRWIPLDQDTGERNHGIDWRFRVSAIR